VEDGGIASGRQWGRETVVQIGRAWTNVEIETKKDSGSGKSKVRENKGQWGCVTRRCAHCTERK
jgi:hypothetical protein